MPAVTVRRGGTSVFDAVAVEPNGQYAARASERFAQPLKRAFTCHERKQSQAIADLRPRDLVDELSNATRSKSKVITGRERLTALRTVLDSYGLDRSDTQREFHDCMIGACAQLIFKDDLESELVDLLAELGVEELHSEFMAITPRRWGKTYSVAMFVVAAAFAIEGVEQAIFSTGRRASQKLLELVYTFICKIPGMKESITKHNVETIWIQGPNGQNDIRKIFSYPSKVKISACAYVCVRVRRSVPSIHTNTLDWVGAR
jgi:hypothetical protein